MKERITLWRIMILVSSSMLLLLFFLWVSMAVVDAHGKIPVQTSRGVIMSVQGTPTVDATVTALEKENLAQEINKLKEDNAWAWVTFFGPVLGYLGAIGTIVVGILVARNNFNEWSRNRRDEREKRAEDQRIEREKRNEERFQSVVEGLGSERTETRVGAAIMLRTFLLPDYDKFYQQAFDLAVAHLRLRQPNRDMCEPLDSLSQALIVVFKEVFPLIRDMLHAQCTHFSSQLLDASRIHLGCAYLAHADLKEAWMPEAFLRDAILAHAIFTEAHLEGTDFTKAHLAHAHFTKAHLEGATLTKAHLNYANLIEANLTRATLTGGIFQWADFTGGHLQEAHLQEAILEGAILTKAFLKGADLTKAHLHGTTLLETTLAEAILREADLKDAILTGATLAGADLTEANLEGTHPEFAYSLKNTKLNGVIGLTQKQHDVCAAKGAIFGDAIPNFV